MMIMKAEDLSSYLVRFIAIVILVFIFSMM